MEAVNVAAEIARRLEVKLFLFHVEEFRVLATNDPSILEAVDSNNREELHREATRAKGRDANRVETFVRFCL